MQESNISASITDDISIETNHVNVYYGDKHAVKDINLRIPKKRVTAFIGPSGCGKSTFLRCFNRMNELHDNVRVEGNIMIDGENIYAKDVTPHELRRKVGMVFQKPNPFPKSIFENVAFGLKIHGMKNKTEMADRIEWSLKSAGLWDEVSSRLNDPALHLSGGQQQRLVIARAIAIEPKVLLMDEPASALDPASTAKIEELMFELKKNFTIVVVTHNMQQAARVSDYTAFLYLGEIVEFNKTKTMFTNPVKSETENYISGKYG